MAHLCCPALLHFFVCYASPGACPSVLADAVLDDEHISKRGRLIVPQGLSRHFGTMGDWHLYTSATERASYPHGACGGGDML